MARTERGGRALSPTGSILWPRVVPGVCDFGMSSKIKVRGALAVVMGHRIISHLVYLFRSPWLIIISPEDNNGIFCPFFFSF